MEYIISSERIEEGKIEIITEKAGHAGVRHVAGWLRRDMQGVFGMYPYTGEVEHEEIIRDSESLKQARYDMVDATLHDVLPVICVSADRGYIAEGLNDRGVIDLDLIRGKRECYIFKVVELDDPYTDPDDTDDSKQGKKTALVIVGSDKRGTIYGMLHLSELMGVSPFTDWLDIRPQHRDELVLTEADELISKEPSVRYRGFFINDEWPAFGNWCNKRFGGFNEKCYEHVFELLLRLKGNYMWPAMWTSIFPDDGPGLASAVLADKLGVVMGMSHHEPCLRQGEEYKYLRGPESIYGDAWDFRKNKEGITRFWEDGLKRGGHLENVITVGMRGEFDSTVLGKEATLGDNIDLIRDVLKTQNELIRKIVNPDLDEVPRMIALYKEVEAFYYGDDTYKGLKGDPELDGVTLMLCDDNFGNLRTLPPQEERDHKGGYGMYYHMDYHGWPISYEWVNSSTLPKIWEQMTQCYEFGVRELWIVNVGDIFTNEYPLSFFLDLAYDYEKWGISNLNAPMEYTKTFVRTQFAGLTEQSRATVEKLLSGYTRIAANRRPEAMNVGVYDPAWYDETSQLLKKCDEYMEEAASVYKRLSDSKSGLYDASLTYGEGSDDDRCVLSDYPFYELVYYPLMVNLNVQKMWLYTGLNHMLAGIHAMDEAADYADKTKECIELDKKLTDELHTIHDGMWYGMGMSEHIGFNYWNEEECSFPVLHGGIRPDKPRIVTCIPGTDRHTEGGVWTKTNLVLDTFLRPDSETGSIILHSVGEGTAEYEICTDTDAFDISDMKGSIECGRSKEIEIKLKDRKEQDKTSISVKTKTGDGTDMTDVSYTIYKISVKSMSDSLTTESVILIPVNNTDYLALKSGTYVWCGTDAAALSSEHYSVITDEKCAPMGYISIEAGHFTRKGSDGEGEFTEITDYGRTLSGMKAFPVTKTYTPGSDAPYMDYDLYVLDEGEYMVRTYVTPANPVYKDNLLRYGISVIRGGAASDSGSGGDTAGNVVSDIRFVDTVASCYAVGDDNDDWKQGVLDNIHISESDETFNKGINTLRIYACDPGFVLQKIVIYKKGARPASSYLGPKETYRV